jgi:REP element-mobilizing transposase RayT
MIMINPLTEKEMKYGIRNSKMLLGEVYFWTDTIKDWKCLLKEKSYKSTIINCWKELVNRNKIIIYGFVIMPNHLHIIWEMIGMNGKEMPHASFNKFTSHQFLEALRAKDSPCLLDYVENDKERKHRFWQRDPLAVCMDSQGKVEQKLDYLHLNPLQEHWNLASKPEDYKWSSAKFYETGIDEFNITTDYRNRF